MPRFIGKRPAQELRQDVTRVAPIAGLEHRLDRALPDSLVQNVRRDPQDRRAWRQSTIWSWDFCCGAESPTSPSSAEEAMPPDGERP